MARFPYYKHNIQALGRLLAEAAANPAVRKRLEENPRAELRRIGLPEEATELFHFKIVSEEADKPVAVLPFQLNQERLNRHDPEYLAQVARTVISTSVN